MLYQISYDLYKEKNYDRLYEGIKSYGDYYKILLSTWTISTTESAQQVYDKLKPLVDRDDFIFISEVNRNRQGYFTKGAWDWINAHQP